MKLPLTDKILWEVYESLEKIHEKIDVFPKSFKESAYVDYKWMRQKYERKYRKKHFKQFVSYLKKKGYIQIENLKTKKGILLTPKGREKAIKMRLKLLEKDFKKLNLKKREDGKYLMVIFDIPEELKDWRNVLRDGLISLGYTFFQKSVWISPFDVLKKTEKLIQECNVEKFVKIFLIEEI